MNKLHKKDFTIAFKTGSDANKSKFKKECVQGEIYFATDTKKIYVAETTAGASDATLAQFDPDATGQPGGPFLTYEITNSGSDFNLRSRSTVDSYDVDWGDGNSETSTATVLAHTYTAGTYTINIEPSGVYRPYYTGLYSGEPADRAQINSVEIDDGINLGTNLTDAYNGTSNMTSFTASNATSTVATFYQTWKGCSGLTSFPVIDSSSGTDFTGAWQSCTGLTSFPSLDFSSATSFRFSWYLSSSLATFPANSFDSTGTLASNAFQLGFSGCALTAQSIENILTSLDSNGASSVTLALNGGTNAVYSTWSSTAQTALSNLQTKGWTVTYNT